ncbi:MAG: MerR family transcriptional regulator [Bacteroidales bacterium]|nr:MerR family transcriptional regulator [Bacteroidales bacterium]MDD4216362.1 MerR family transcriptional regulator [Bacteroidales bacterium]MDY0140480.1 MerR family transcriptional regulator [Bacteroidales bacterium]
MKAKNIDNIKIVSKQYYTIKDLELISGIKAHTIRIWEQRYNALEPNRTETNIRYYTDNDLKKLLNIGILIKLGYKISQLSKYNGNELNTLVLSKYSTIKKSLIEPLIINMINFDALEFMKILEDNIASDGFESTIELLIYPLIDRIGMLWQTNSITPAHEHFVSNLLKQKLFAEIDKLPKITNHKSEYLLFLPENEYHELGLLYSYYLLKSRGESPVYIGQNVPTIDVIKTANILHCKYLVCFFVSKISQKDANNILKDLLENTTDTTILVAGSDIILKNVFNNDRVKKLENPESLKDY